ncbi:MAG: 3'-5' exonuclease [Deltaproteobacteria bacterium]|nr:3'-5' exonuclease [Deltaproteobacteria bacterium]
MHHGPPQKANAVPGTARPSKLVSRLFSFQTPKTADIDDVVLLRACLDCAHTESLEDWARNLSLPHTLSRPRLKTLLVRSSLSGSDALKTLDEHERARVITRIPSLANDAPNEPSKEHFYASQNQETNAQRRPARQHIEKRLLEKTTAPSSAPPSFVAIDFETASNDRGSACALAALRIEGGRVTSRFETLIRPPRLFVDPHHTRIHGLRAVDLKDAPRFDRLWPRLAAMFSGVDFIVAHNAAFDRSVLEACCRQAAIAPPAQSYLCTVQLARQTFDLPAYKLNIVASHLRIPLQHHDAGSDAKACARIALEVWRQNPKAYEPAMIQQAKRLQSFSR